VAWLLYVMTHGVDHAIRSYHNCNQCFFSEMFCSFRGYDDSMKSPSVNIWDFQIATTLTLLAVLLTHPPVMYGMFVHAAPCMFIIAGNLECFGRNLVISSTIGGMMLIYLSETRAREAFLTATRSARYMYLALF